VTSNEKTLPLPRPLPGRRQRTGHRATHNSHSSAVAQYFDRGFPGGGGIGNKVMRMGKPPADPGWPTNGTLYAYVRAKFCALGSLSTDDNASYVSVQAISGPAADGTFLWQMVANNRFHDALSMDCYFNNAVGGFGYGNMYMDGSNTETLPPTYEVQGSPSLYLEAGVDICGTDAYTGSYICSRSNNYTFVVQSARMRAVSQTRHLDPVTGDYVSLGVAYGPWQTYDCKIANPLSPMNPTVLALGSGVYISNIYSPFLSPGAHSYVDPRYSFTCDDGPVTTGPQFQYQAFLSSQIIYYPN
jgi:hypothetical protein